jgi:hypothetical protein
MSTTVCRNCATSITGACIYPNRDAERPLIPDGGCVTLPGITLAGVTDTGDPVSCDIGLCDQLTLGAGLTVICDETGTTLRAGGEVGCGLTVADDGLITVIGQSLRLFEDVNLVVNNTGAFVATTVPVNTVEEACLITGDCQAARAEAGGIRVLRDGVYTIDTYSRVNAPEIGGPATLRWYRHRIEINGVVSAKGWPGVSMNVSAGGGTWLDGVTGNTSQTLCLDENDFITIEVATRSDVAEPITVTTAGLGVSFHGARP